MYTIEKIKLNIAKEINKALGKKLVQASDLVYPPNSEMGDLSFNVFFLFKKIKKEPKEIAKNIISKIKPSQDIKRVEAVGPYVNFFINKEYLTKNVLSEVGKQKNKYGANKIGKSKKVMVEYTNANTHKEYHVGHLRNLCYGDAVQRILAVNGYKSIPVSYINDFGIHVAKTLWNYDSYVKKITKGIKGYTDAEKGQLLGKIYVDATKKEKKQKAAKQMISAMMKKIETRKGEEYNLWEETRSWSIRQFEKIYKEMNVKLKYVFYESESIDKGRKMIPDLIKKKILKKSQGAVIADLKKYGLEVLVVLRSDGSTTYPVADIPLAQEKLKKYKLDKSIYVVDVRQSLYFKQLFKILELLGHKEEMIHLGYEFVKLPSGMMSSRAGNVITYEELKTSLFSRALMETRKRHHKDWSKEEIKEVAMKITVGVIKFEMIKVGANQIITFGIDKALKFEGNTAPYLQYTYARIQSILRKSGARDTKCPMGHLVSLVSDKEHGLILQMAKYPEIVAKASQKYDPSEVARYLLELAQFFNDYYHSVPVLKAEKNVREARLVLINSVAQVLENGLDLLGIEVVEKM